MIHENTSPSSRHVRRWSHNPAYLAGFPIHSKESAKCLSRDERSNWVWIYKMGRFAEERRVFLSDLNEQGHSMQTLRNVNRFLLAIAERVNVRRSSEITDVQIVRAARDWVAKSCAPDSRAETREAAAKRFVYIAKNWLRFLGKWRDPERNPQFRAELESFLRSSRPHSRPCNHSAFGGIRPAHRRGLCFDIG